MSSAIIACVRRSSHLRGTQLFLAIEIAHRMNRSGYGRVSYTHMGRCVGCSRMSAIRYMRVYVQQGIFAKTVYRLANGYAINLYKCLLPVPAFYQASPQNQTGNSVLPILPTPKTEEEKSLSLQEEIRRQQWALDNLTLSREARESCQEKLAMLMQRAL